MVQLENHSRLVLSWNKKFHWTISCRIHRSNIVVERVSLDTIDRIGAIIRGMVLSWNKIRWNEAELERYSRLVLSWSIEFRLNTSMIGRITPLERASSALYMLM